jgi:hypothetical protein
MQMDQNRGLTQCAVPYVARPAKSCLLLTFQAQRVLATRPVRSPSPDRVVQAGGCSKVGRLPSRLGRPGHRGSRFRHALLNDPNWAERNITILGLAARSVSCRLPLINRLEHEQHPTNVDILPARPCDLADAAAAPVLLKVGDGGRKHFCGSR